jgi:hypothetical protein
LSDLQADRLGDPFTSANSKVPRACLGLAPCAFQKACDDARAARPPC